MCTKPARVAGGFARIPFYVRSRSPLSKLCEFTIRLKKSLVFAKSDFGELGEIGGEVGSAKLDT